MKTKNFELTKDIFDAFKITFLQQQKKIIFE